MKLHNESIIFLVIVFSYCWQVRLTLTCKCAYGKTKCCHLLTQAVLEVHDNSASEVADEASIIKRLGGGAGNEIPAVDPHHDRHRAPQR